MPFTPNRLSERRVAVTFPFDGEMMRVEYRPAALNDEMQKKIKAISERIAELGASSDDDSAEAEALSLQFAECASQILTSWDYCEDGADGQAGEMVPLTPERILQEMRRFGDFVMTCILAALQDYQASKLDGAVSSSPSAATSSATGKSTNLTVVRSRNGSK